MRLQLIQALRAIAAYLVLFYHIRAFEEISAKEVGTNEAALIGGPFATGWAGVDLFFVISGFIMVYVTFSRPQTLSAVRDFLTARFFRIFPPWWLFAGIMASFYLVKYGVPYAAEEVAAQGNHPLNHLIRSIFLMPQPNFPILGVGWTLVHEIWFYLVFSILMLLPRKSIWAWLIVWALIVTGGALMGWASAFSANYLELAMSPLTLEFIAGGLAGYLAVKGYKTFALWIGLLGAAAFLAGLWLHPYPTPFTLIWGRVLVFTLPCAMMVYAAAALDDRIKGRFWSVLSKLGDWSFALYLCHHFTIAGLRSGGYVIAAKAEAMLGLEVGTLNFLRLGSPGIADNLFFVVTSVIAPTILAALVYYFFEKPTLKFLNAKFRKRQPDKQKRDMLETTAP